MEPGVPIDEVKAPTNEFFERAKARLNREVTPALTDFEAPVRIRGDLDLDPALWEKAGVKATRPAAVYLGPPRADDGGRGGPSPQYRGRGP